MENLVGIDVPDAGNHMLVKEQRLDGAFPCVQQTPKDIIIEVVDEWVDAESCQLGQHLALVRWVVHHDFTKRAWVDEPKLMCVVSSFPALVSREGEDDMRVWWSWMIRGMNEHAPAHAQMDHHSITTRHITDEVFAATTSRRERHASETMDDGLSTDAPNRSLAPHRHRRDGATDDE